jgi:hypothetical protein
MITVGVCYSNRVGQEFASCTLGGVELGAELLDQPAVLAIAIRRAYDRCREAVDAQPGSQTVADAPAAVKPALPPSPPAPPTVGQPNRGRTSYGKGNGRGQDAPPTTGRQLGAVAKKRGALGFFEALGAAQDPPLPRFLGDRPDDVACWAWAVYQASCIPPRAAQPEADHEAFVSARDDFLDQVVRVADEYRY